MILLMGNFSLPQFLSLPNKITFYKLNHAIFMKVLSVFGIFLTLFNHGFLQAQVIAPAEILISEILFNPKPNGVDFVEIYNASNRAIDLSQLYIANKNSNGQVANVRRISTTPLYIQSGAYRVLTTDPTLVLQHYSLGSANTFIRLSSLPPYPNTEGHVILLTNWLGNTTQSAYIVIDSLHYWEKMHTPYLRNVKGVSLERVSFDLPTNAANNFRSAAIASGGATPGLPNSQTLASETSLKLVSRILSPDYDGIDDELIVEYAFQIPQLMASIQLFNSKGQFLQYLLRNSSIATQGSWKWNGQDQSGKIYPSGLYTLVIEVYNEYGYRKIFRKSFVLTMRN